MFLFESGDIEGAVAVAVDLIAQLHRFTGQFVLIDDAEHPFVLVDVVIAE